MATVVVGDDQIVFLDALSDVIEQHGHTVVAVARDTAQMLALVRSRRPDLCLIDRHRPRSDDGDTIAALRAESARTRAVILGADPGASELRRVLNAGASGYIHMSRGVNALVSGLERVLSGEIVVDVPDSPPRPRRPAPSHASQLAARLTSRERECLMMLVAGLDTGAMVERLGVSRTTVRSHMHAVLTKLGVHSRLEAASFAVRYRLADAWSADTLAPAADLRSMPRLRAIAAPGAVTMSRSGRESATGISATIPAPPRRRRGGVLLRSGG